MKLKFLYIFFISQIIYSQQFRNITDISDLNGIVGNNGVAVADYDQDGDLDIFIVSEDGNENISRLLQNTNNGNFIDITENSGINQNLNHDIDLINKWPKFSAYSDAYVFMTDMRFEWYPGQQVRTYNNTF